MGEVDPAFGHADFLAGGVRGCGEGEEGVVREADVFGGDNDEAAGDVEGVFARGEHAREVVEGGVGVGAADGFVEGGDGVVCECGCLLALDLFRGKGGMYSVDRLRGRRRGFW